MKRINIFPGSKIKVIEEHRKRYLMISKSTALKKPNVLYPVLLFSSISAGNHQYLNRDWSVVDNVINVG